MTLKLNDISLKSMSVNMLKEYGAVWKINRKCKVTTKISYILLGITALRTQVVERGRFPGSWLQAGLYSNRIM